MKSLKFNRLLKKIKTDKRALDKIYAEYYPKMIMHLNRKFGNLVSGEDIAQDVFVSLMTTEITDDVDYPASWMYRLSDYRAIDVLKLKHDEPPIPDDLAVNFDLDRLIMEEDVKRYLARLDKTSQMILYLHFWEGYQHDEIAEMLGLSCNNVRTKTSRAYAELRRILKKSK